MTALKPKRYKWTDQEKEDILAVLLPRLAQGEPLALILREDGMPGVSTVYEWGYADEAIAERIAHAREDGEEAIAANCLEIADLSNPEDVQVAKLRIHTRFQLLARWNPDKWGEKARQHAPVAAQAPTVVVVGIEPRAARPALEGEVVVKAIGVED